ncbi:hypothetical protein GOB57_24900 [Sinorhizobium meliloti]|nr:hypothetical protein [Sinorhizobium meliloti]
MNPISTFDETLHPYRDHLHEVWLRTTGSDKTVDPILRERFEAAKSALEAEDSDVAASILETGAYLIDCYERLVRGERVGDLAEAEGGYSYYIRKLDQVAEVGSAPST